VGDQALIRVHIHTKDPQAVMDYCATKGSLKDIVKENLDDQVKAVQKKKRIAKPETSEVDCQGRGVKPIRARDIRLKNQAVSP
jgi:dihydroxyacetone kinase-like predicted kinase